MKTDYELLELAARLHGANPHVIYTRAWYDDLTPDRLFWNPLRDDGDALRLAVNLGLEVYKGSDEVGDLVGVAYFIEGHSRPRVAIEYYKDHDDAFSATRRAIVRASAEIQLWKEKAGIV